MSSPSEKPMLLLDAHSATPEWFQFRAGEVAVFSRRSPDKNASNEDGVMVVPVDDDRLVLAVADGCGGMTAGGKAARIALTVLQNAIQKSVKQEAENLRIAILDGIETANASVLQLGIGAATTLAIAELNFDFVRPYHIGDSQIVLVGNRGKLKMQTSPHSPVGYAVEAGMISEREAMDHEDRHFVSNVIGTRDGHIEIGSPRRLSPRDTLVVATDGVFDNLRVDTVCETIRKGPLPLAANELAAHFAQAEPSTSLRKPDDATFILFRRRCKSAKPKQGKSR